MLFFVEILENEPFPIDGVALKLIIIMMLNPRYKIVIKIKHDKFVERLLPNKKTNKMLE